VSHPQPQSYPTQPPYPGQPGPQQPYAPYPQPYAQPAYAGQGYPGAQADPLAPACRMCGSVPAVKVTFRGHRGFIVLMQFLSAEGPFCRDCGLGTFRSMTSRTLVQGWYGYASFIITPITVLINLVRHDKVASLSAPGPHPNGHSARPMDPGPRLLARPMTWVGMFIPFFLILLIILLATSGD
jgi:hypothetical protein